MSVAVELANLGERVEEYGAVALVVTVGADGRPHVVSARVGFDGGVVTAGVGLTTAANASARGDVTVVWPALPGGDYCLIVDGQASVTDSGDGHGLAVAPVRAVLHRVAGAPGDLPSCVTVLDQRA